jgi:hypothetical protein
MFVSTVSGAVTKKAKGETTKKLAPEASTETNPQAEPKKTPVAAGLTHIPFVPTPQVLTGDESDPDLPQHMHGTIDKAEYLRLRDEYIGLLRGIDPALPIDLARRSDAIRTMEHQVPTRPGNVPFPGWMPLGPSPVPNGQTQQFPNVTPVSGRATCVVVDPTNSNKVYLGTAQGGVWRTLDGGATWTPIFDTAQSLSIGALALAPSNASILYVGTGEPNNSADSYFGVGVYRIDNADTTATLVGPINPSITTGTTTALTYNCFNGRTISRILVNPTDPANIFVSTAAGVAGAAGNALSNTIPPLALRGVFRSANATAAAGTVTFQKIVVNTDGSLDAPGTGNTSIFDMVFEPGNANNLLVSTSGAATGGVIMRSTNALAATPTFTQVLFPGFNGLVMHLAINKVGAVVTAYVASNEPSTVAACSSIGQAGRVRKSIDGGATWGAPLVAAEGYCGGQCSYDNPIAVDPNDANIVYIGGNARGTCSDVLKRSANGGTSFTRDDTGLHADSHSLFIDPLTVPSTVWFTNDGGVWKRQDAAAGTAWLNQNTNGLNTIQFVSLAVHPTDQFLTIGGTQDNGTEAMTGSYGNWVSAESGDGGFALIDQSSTDTTNVTMYHTFFNQTNNFIGFDRTNLGTCLPPPDANKDSWEFRGGGFSNDPTLSCDGTAFTLSNGILAADTVLFYAPMALGPGTPNTLYFGTNKLYRSTDRGDTMVAVSQNPIVAGVAVSAIGISPTNDNVRIVGLRNGKVFATTTGANPLLDTGFVAPTNATASATNKHVARAVIDPLNNNTAYLTLAYYTNPSTAGQIWRTTNLNAASPTWTSIGNTGVGLPNVPVNGFVVDAGDPGFPGVSVLYAGTDIGVYVSTDSGASWNPFGNPLLPRVAVFDLVLQPSFRILRAATHGRGAWQIGLPGSSCVPVPPTPTVTPSGATTFCAGGSVTLTSSSATGNQWYDGVTLLPGQTNQTYVATTSGNYNVVFTALCPSAHSASTAVTVNPLPATPTISGALAFCTGGSTTLTSSSASGNQWYLGGDPLPSATGQNYIATAAGSYTVQVTDGNGCVSAMSAPAVVTVNPLPATPTITPGGPTTFCAGGSVTLTSSAASGNQWLLNGNPIGGATNTTYVANANGSYTVTATDGNSCTSAASAATVVTVNPLPAAPTITPGGPTTFCAGGSVTLTSSAASGNQWLLNGNPIGGATNTTYVANANGSYTVTTTDGNSCTSAASAATIVTVNPLPATPTATPGGPTTFCAGGSVTLTSSSASGNQWLLNGSPIGAATNQTYPATLSGSYTVTTTDGNSCTSAASAAVVVTVNPLPATPTITPGGPTTFCTGGSVTLTSSAASGNQWLLNGNPIGGATATTYNATASGNYTVTTTDGNSCTSAASAATTVTVNPIPPTPVIGTSGPTTFCAGGSVTLTSSSASGNQWSLNGNPIGGATNQQYVASATGNYTVTVTTTGCTSAASAATAVTVNPIPATPTITPGGPTTFCTGGSVTLTSSSASGNQWYLNGNPIGGATSQTYPATGAGSYTVKVTTSGCTSAASAATVVTVNPNPNATITAPASVTTSSTGNVASVANAGVGATYAWSVTGGTLTGGNNTPSITFTAGATPGTLTINLTVTTSAGCSDTKSANVNRVLPIVTVTSVVPNFGTVTGGTNVTINGTNFAAGAAVTFGGTAATNVVVVSAIKITAKTPAHAAGAVNVTVTNTDTSTGTLTAGYLYQAQVFDPNGDGVIDPADIFFLINYLFTGGPAPHGPAGLLSGDANGDGVVDPADIFYLVNYLFLGGQKPNRPTSISDNPRATAVGNEAPEIAGSIALGKPVLRAGHYFVPVVMTSRGSATPQSMSLKLHVDGDAAVGDVIVRRAGAAKEIPTIFETSRRSGNDVSYLVAYDPRGIPFDESRSAVVAEIEIVGAGANMTVSIDPLLTMLSNQGGTSKATVANGHLEVRGTAAAGDSSPRPRAPGHEVN